MSGPAAAEHQTGAPLQFSGANQAKSVLNEWFATRDDHRARFVAAHGWGDATLTPMREDMGARRYFRLTRPNGQTAVLMESVPDGHELATPGQRLDDYVVIADLLRANGLSAPRVYAQDFDTGYLLIDDFGDLSFRDAMLKNIVDRNTIYGTAMSVIQKMCAIDWPAARDRDTYYEGAMYKGLRRMIDWYAPVKRNQPNENGLVDEFLNRWNMVEDAVTDAVGEPLQGFIHCDFHLENLQWRDGQTGLARAGVLDFQDARIGPAVYDLTNLLNDARMSLPPDYKRARLEEFLSGLPATQRDNFRAWFWVYSGQFLHRVAGQFVKHATIGNTRYMSFMPFIQANLKDIMSEPVMAPVRELMAELGVDLEPFADGTDFAALTRLIAPDAY
jgi:hypothetical protein